MYKTLYAQLCAIGSCFSPLFVRKVEMVLLLLIVLDRVLKLTLEKIYELFTKDLISDNLQLSLSKYCLGYFLQERKKKKKKQKD